jgi:PadR family transcriptional regulator, regulatory protein PadR
VRAGEAADLTHPGKPHILCFTPRSVRSMPKPVEFRQGAIELLILRALSWGPQHGFSVARWIQDTTDDVLRLEEGSLYPTLHRLEDKGWITSRWGVSAANRRARFYELTAGGRKQLVAETRDWWRYAEAIAKVLKATARPAPV